jgi:hypothetical protein|eukprot:COSAG06_NODE_584_length_14005_cov_23.423486_7_plen_49_part_00
MRSLSRRAAGGEAAEAEAKSMRGYGLAALSKRMLGREVTQRSFKAISI